MLLYPEKVEAWSRKHHANRVLHLCELERNVVPLILFEGDVGTGKTAVAETIGDALQERRAARATYTC
jgi:tRNA A37 threonylcarbamoyladenosine biosynthesis protein TsaE